MQEAMISPAQMRMMYGVARKCSMDDDTLHSLVQNIAKKDSIKELNKYEAKRVIDYLMHLNGQAPKNIPNRATEAQRRMIYALAKSLGMSDDSKRLRKFLEARFSVADVAFLPGDKVSSVIEALKAMEKRELKKVKEPGNHGQNI